MKQKEKQAPIMTEKELKLFQLKKSLKIKQSTWFNKPKQVSISHFSKTSSKNAYPIKSFSQTTTEMIKKKENDKFVKEQQDRLKFENMVHGKFIFDELYNKKKDTLYDDITKEQDY